MSPVWYPRQRWCQRSILLCLLVAGCLLSLPTASAGQTPLPLSADQLLLFAEHLAQEGDYARAIAEYQRFLVQYPEEVRRPMAHFSIGLAWYRRGQFAEALQTFRDVSMQYPHTSWGQHAWLWQGESLIRQGDHAAAGHVYEAAAQQFRGEPLEHQARYQQAWTLLYRRQWHDAAGQFQRIPAESPLYPSAQALVQGAQAGAQLPTKSPALAGTLSALLPGSGQVYNERFGDALLAFVLNGLFIAGAFEAAQHHAHAVAGVLSFFALGWYSGNVYGAINGAHKYNRFRAETLLRNLDNTLHVPTPRQTPTLGFQLRLGF